MSSRRGSPSNKALKMEIRTKSVEQTLIPLVTQITTLVNQREHISPTERSRKQLSMVGMAVHHAVERFCCVGSRIGENNKLHIGESMLEACKDARMAGSNIQSLTSMDKECLPLATSSPTLTSNPLVSNNQDDKTVMVRAARHLLSAITRVLLLADMVVVKQLINAKTKVLNSLAAIEDSLNFHDFVKSFSTFGNEMVLLAHLSGDRQNDLKVESHRAQLSTARSTLEHSTMQLLTSTKTRLRHSELESAKRNRAQVLSDMRRALAEIENVCLHAKIYQSSTLLASRLDKELQDQVDLSRVTDVDCTMRERIVSALSAYSDAVHDFTDSSFTSAEHRDALCADIIRVQDEVKSLVEASKNTDTKNSKDIEQFVLNTRASCTTLKKRLHTTAMAHCKELFQVHGTAVEARSCVNTLRESTLHNDQQSTHVLAARFRQCAEQLQEACKLLQHVATTDTLQMKAEHVTRTLYTLAPQVLLAIETLASFTDSKIAIENVSVFNDAWSCAIDAAQDLSREIDDTYLGRSSAGQERRVYLSLPRPGKHGTTSKQAKPVKLNAQEQAKIAKLGLEMKLLTSEMDAETDKWQQPDNEVVRRARNMSSMAFSMYLFTRGDGALNTTEDLFTQARYFGEEGSKLFRVVQEFSKNVPIGQFKNELMSHLHTIPVCCQQLMFTIKSPTLGKAATFNKVDSVIQETKNLMNSISKVVTCCFICMTKYNMDYRILLTCRENSRHASPINDAISPSNRSRSESLQKRFAFQERSSSLSKPNHTYSSFEQL